LNYCLPGDIIGIMIDGENRLKLFVNRIDFGVAAINMPADCYGVVDLYGQCEQVNTSTFVLLLFQTILKNYTKLLRCP